MKPKYLIIAGTTILAISLMSFIKAKTAQAKDVFTKILYKISLPKRLDISLNRLRFYIDVTLQNPTAQDFTASSGGLITAKVFRVYRGTELLGFGQLPNINSVALQAGGKCSFNDIYIEIPTTDLARQLWNVTGGADSWKKLLNNIFPKDTQSPQTNQQFVETLKANSMKLLSELRYELDIETLGQLYTFNKNII